MRRPPICPQVPSEDGFLVGDYAARYARAMQEGEDTRYLKSVSTAKCYSVYDVENSDGTDRFHFNASVSDHDWVEYYALPYRLAVQHGHVGSMMCGYPAVNGVPNCMNAFYTNTVAHELWGWDGFLVSDCGGVSGIFQTHHVASSPEEAVAFAVHGGLQVACDTFFPLYMADAVAEGLLALDDLRAAALQFLPWAFHYGVMDPPERQPYKRLGAADVDTPAHRQLALEAAVQSAVLLQNNATSSSSSAAAAANGAAANGAGAPVLPLAAASLRRIALIGPLANESADLLSNYHGDNTLVANHSLLSALQARAAADGFVVDYAQGCGPDAGCDDQTGFAAAVAAARAADVAIVALGLCVASCSGASNRWHEGEGHDRGVLTLPGNQTNLALAVAASGTPTVVVLVHGGPVALENITGAVAAIVDLHYGGELGGDAAVHVLFGDSPAAASGRLTTTFYPASFVATRKVTDMNLSSNEGLTYMYYSGTPVLQVLQQSRAEQSERAPPASLVAPKRPAAIALTPSPYPRRPRSRPSRTPLLVQPLRLGPVVHYFFLRVGLARARGRRRGRLGRRAARAAAELLRQRDEHRLARRGRLGHGLLLVGRGGRAAHRALRLRPRRGARAWRVSDAALYPSARGGGHGQRRRRAGADPGPLHGPHRRRRAHRELRGGHRRAARRRARRAHGHARAARLGKGAWRRRSVRDFARKK